MVSEPRSRPKAYKINIIYEYKYTKKIESDNLNNSIVSQIIREQNNTIIQQLKEFIKNHKNNQIEVVNEIRYNIIGKNIKQIALIETRRASKGKCEGDRSPQLKYDF